MNRLTLGHGSAARARSLPQSRSASSTCARIHRMGTNRAHACTQAHLCAAHARGCACVPAAQRLHQCMARRCSPGWLTASRRPTAPGLTRRTRPSCCHPRRRSAPPRALPACTHTLIQHCRPRALVRACVRAHPSAASDRRTPSTSDDCSASASRLLWWRPSATPTRELVCCCTRVRGGDEYADAVAGDAVAGVSVSLSDERAEPPLVGEADEPAKPSQAKPSQANPFASSSAVSERYRSACAAQL